MTEKEHILQTLLDRNYAETLFGTGKREGKEVRTHCPLCGGHNLTYRPDQTVWYCWNCGKGGDWFTFLQLRDNLTYWEAYKLLATAAGVKVKQSKQQQAAEERTRRLEAARLAYLDLCKREAASQSGRARAAIDWLRQRGYAEADQQRLARRLFASPDPATALAALLEAGHTEADLKAAGLLTSGGGLVGYGAYRIVIPWYVRSGLAGFVFRSVDPAVDPKYLYTAGLAKTADLLGLPEARQLARQQQQSGGRSVGLLLVEGVIDSLLLTEAGLPTAAIGGAALSEKQAAAVKAAGFGLVWLALDNDPTGQQGILPAVHKLGQVGVEAYVCRVEDYVGCKDPDELYRRVGVGGLRQLTTGASTAGVWLASQTVGKADPDLSSQGRRELLRSARAALRQLRKPEDRQDFMQELADLTSIDPDLLTAGLADVDREWQRQRQQEAIAEILQGGLAAVQALANDPDNDLADLTTRLVGELEAARRSGQPDLPARYTLEDLTADLNAKTAGLVPFFARQQQDGLPDLTIPAGALTVLSGQTGGGKTTLMLNLLADWLTNDPTGHYYMFSYEEQRVDLLLKLVMVVAGHVFQPETNLNAYRGYLTGAYRPDQPVEAVDAALDLVGGWLEDGRLTVYDQPLNATDLADRLHQLDQQVGKPAGVIVDYIQKIPLPEGRGKVRYLDLQATSGYLLAAAVSLDIPVVVGAQLNKAGSVREAQDIEFDTALWLNLLPDPEDPDLLTVDIQKNRGGRQGLKYALRWNRPARTMTTLKGV